MKRLVLAIELAVIACGGASSRTAVVEPPQPLPMPPSPDTSSSEHVSSAGPTKCLAPWEHAVGDPKVDPKPVDPNKLLEADRTSDAVEGAFMRARAFFEAQHWVESAEGFRPISFEHPDSTVGMYAAQLYLESINVLGGASGRPQCYEDMVRDVPPLLDLYCQARRKAHEEECTMLDRIQSDVLRLRAQSAFELADQSSDKTAMHAAAEKYLALLRTDCVPPHGHSACDELAYNAGYAFLASGDVASAERVRAIMLDPKNAMDQSPLAAKLVCLLDKTCP